MQRTQQSPIPAGLNSSLSSLNKARHVKVVIRTRPTANFAQDIMSFGQDKKKLHIHIPKGDEGGFINNQQENWDFRFDQILHNASQEVVYDECGAPIVKGLLDGYNGTILAYGQTGAGKTFTMTGGSENYKHRGVIPRAISHLFKEIADRPQTAHTVRISYLEIYKEQMGDLLSGVASQRNWNGTSDAISLTVGEEKSGSTQIKGLTTQIVSSEEEALNLLFEGEMTRSVSEHQMNRNSSRSHCIFTIYVESRSRVESSEKVLYSKLNLVDLAGSERLSKTETSGISLKEAMYINRSLTFLEQVIIALSDKKRDHIPYRQSKMTHVLKDSLGGNCNTLMIANIWGEKVHIEETISTLRFATRMMCVTNSPEINVQYDAQALIKKYEREIRDLKQELSMHDTLVNRSQVQYEAYSDAQRYELQKQVKTFLETDNAELEIISLRQTKEIFNQFKILFKSLEAEKEESVRRVDRSGKRAGSVSEIPADNYPKTALEADRDDGVGETDGSGFGIGVVPSNRKGKLTTAPSFKKPPPKGGKTLAQVLALEQNRFVSEEEESGAEEPTETEHHPARVIDLQEQILSGPPRDRHAPRSRAEEFDTFKQEKGYLMYRNLTENKNSLKDKRKIAKDLAQVLNDVKNEMDKLKFKSDQRKAERAELESHGLTSDKVIMDEEEFAMLKKIKVLRATYQDQYEQLKVVRSEIDYCSGLVDQCRQKFMTEFEQWYETIYGGQGNDNATLNGIPEDVLDVGEKFDRLQIERMSQEDPDSLPFYNARKNTERKKVVQKKAPLLKNMSMKSVAA